MRGFIIGLLFTSMASPVLAEKSEKDAQTDQNKVICRYSAEIGTRLAKKKTCLTRSEWAQYEREMRTAVQRVQDLKTITDHN